MSADWSYFWGNSGNRSSTDDPRHPNPASEDDEIEPDQGNGMCFSLTFYPLYPSQGFALGAMLTKIPIATVLSHIISQLRPGADLSRVVLPTFILEPRSMLERITKYVSFG
jgi:hypothetical protein